MRAGPVPATPLSDAALAGPDGDFHRRVKVVAESQAQGVWVNRYGYLGDPKLESIRLLLGGGAADGATEAAKL